MQRTAKRTRLHPHALRLDLAARMLQQPAFPQTNAVRPDQLVHFSEPLHRRGHSKSEPGKNGVRPTVLASLDTPPGHTVILPAQNP